MQKLIKKTAGLVKKFLDELTERKAEGIIQFYEHIFETGLEKKGEGESQEQIDFGSERYSARISKKGGGKMQRIASIIILAVIFTFGIGIKPSSAAKIDILLEKLVAKGVLTSREAQDIRAETEKELQKEIAEGKFSNIPAWVENLQFSGDLRLRHQWEDKSDDSLSGRHRMRARLRLGLQTKLAEEFNVYAGLISGSSDPRSGNQTLQDSFSTKPINLDYAYLAYAPFSELTLYGGKIKQSPLFWKTNDFLWSNDINPEGVALGLTHALDFAKLFMNTGFFILEESGSKSNEPYVAYFQPGMDWKISDAVGLKGAVAYYLINTQGWNMDHSSDTNTKIGANHRYNYNAVNPALQLNFKEPFGGLVPYLALFGEYAYAVNPSSDNQAWSLGFKFGDSRVRQRGQWQLSYLYRWLERDAWLDCFPDGSAYGGGTNIQGHKVGLSYGLAKNVSLGLNYYNLEPIKDLSINGQDGNLSLIQTDLSIRF